MKQKAACVLILLSFIFCILYAKPVEGQSQNNLVINADGTVTPSTAPIQKEGDSYTLTGDVIGSISILKSDLIFNGNGYSLIAIGDLRHGREGLTVGLDAYSSPPVLTGATNVTIKNLNVNGGIFGISFINTTNSTITNNTVTGTGNGYYSIQQQSAGIYLERGNMNVVKGNTISNNYNGIICVETTNNLIVENRIAGCTNPWGSSVGLAFWDAPNNRVYHNNFLYNEVNAYGGVTVGVVGTAPLANNSWSNGFPDGGNYWSDYKTKYPNAAELNGSGIGDVAYQIDANNQDGYPLLEPFNSTLYAIRTSPPKIAISTLADQTYNDSNVPLLFTTNKEIEWAGYSLDGQSNVTLSGNGTLTNVPNGVHTVTVYANDTFGNMGAETFSFAVAVPEVFPVAAVVAVLGMSAVAVGVGLAVYFKRRRR
ncbi:MAG: right-handed parallel beta-helix repeat-containing protein [Candidatus Bathyarchaeota archaeon]|nr:right-handed parallel beta-helix repeat-containing protein [Candidatus Bathyarchaeota archaeon]